MSRMLAVGVVIAAFTLGLVTISSTEADAWGLATSESGWLSCSGGDLVDGIYVHEKPQAVVFGHGQVKAENDYRWNWGWSNWSSFVYGPQDLSPGASTSYWYAYGGQGLKTSWTWGQCA